MGKCFTQFFTHNGHIKIFQKTLYPEGYGVFFCLEITELGRVDREKAENQLTIKAGIRIFLAIPLNPFHLLRIIFIWLNDYMFM